MVASKRLSSGHENHVVNIPDTDEKVLKTAVIYGANGAGKSNLFKAIDFLRNIALKPKKKNSGTGREAFCFCLEKQQTSDFDLQFTLGNKLYRYGIRVDDHKIVEEWLVHVVGVKEKPIYERTTDDNGKVKVKGLKKSGEKLKALVTVGSPQNQSFLATVRIMLEPENYGILGEIIEWFEDSLTLIAPDTSFASLGQLLEKNPDFLEFASEFLKASSTGVNRLNVQKNEMTEDELRHFLPKELVSRILEDFDSDDDGTALIIAQGKELLIERTDQNHYFRFTIQAEHRHPELEGVTLDLNDESDGTQRLLNLLPTLHHLKNSKNAVFFIDEIDRSMHPVLSKRFLEFFLNSCNGGQHQIIVTTHESNLLDLDLLRRDEIWFAEKDDTSATRLYSLTDFKIRNDLDVRKGYLQGRFGAIPFLGNLDYLLSEKEIRP